LSSGRQEAGRASLGRTHVYLAPNAVRLTPASQIASKQPAAACFTN